VNSDSMDHVQDSCIDVLGILTDFRVALWMRDLTAAGSLIEKAAIDNFRKRKSAMDVSQALSFDRLCSLYLFGFVVTDIL
jgi:hypothetical protein